MRRLVAEIDKSRLARAQHGACGDEYDTAEVLLPLIFIAFMSPELAPCYERNRRCNVQVGQDLEILGN